MINRGVRGQAPDVSDRDAASALTSAVNLVCRDEGQRDTSQ